MSITAIAFSGGIDSLAAAYLLKEQGRELIGIHFQTGYETEDTQSVEFLAGQIGIKLEIIDCHAVFQSKVVDYFTQSYQSGQTPNPCLVCNSSIKFGVMLEAAQNQGASELATGHYARIQTDPTGRYHLLKGLDPQKDQSYFLGFLSQEQLAHACLPLGDKIKSEVKQWVSEKFFHPQIRQESQDVCFIKGKNYGDFLVQQQGIDDSPGPIEDINGKVLGQHKGLHLFTIGQRRGINCPGSQPYYVVRIDRQQNRLIVGFKQDLLAGGCQVRDINWIQPTRVLPIINVNTRVRYRHHAVPSLLIPMEKNKAIIRFETPQSAITPGQGAVFYKENEVLGAGWIESSSVILDD